MRPGEFVANVRAIKFSDTFNPYADRCPVHDVPTAPTVRSQTLLAMLDSATTGEIDAIWIGRDLGHRGGRRTGLALTDDAHVGTHAARWGISAGQPTKGIAIAERTAAVIWRVLSQIESAIFLWNVFPLHPHEPEDPFSNRAHNSQERQAGEAVLASLIELLRPRRLIAIGNDADNSARRLSKCTPVIGVRHPSYGGQTEFTGSIETLYGLRRRRRVVKSLPRDLG